MASTASGAVKLRSHQSRFVGNKRSEDWGASKSVVDVVAELPHVRQKQTQVGTHHHRGWGNLTVGSLACANQADKVHKVPQRLR